jgi:hypothetical protein
MEKVSNDPACNLDQNANFVRPTNLLNDFDVNFISKDTTAIDKDLGSLDNMEEIAAESDYAIPASQQAPAQKQTPKETSNKQAPKKQEIKANKEAQKPKAVLPPKKN